jgi:hypothetical protein
MHTISFGAYRRACTAALLATILFVSESCFAAQNIVGLWSFNPPGNAEIKNVLVDFHADGHLRILLGVTPEQLETARANKPDLVRSALTVYQSRNYLGVDGTWSMPNEETLALKVLGIAKFNRTFTLKFVDAKNATLKAADCSNCAPESIQYLGEPIPPKPNE